MWGSVNRESAGAGSSNHLQTSESSVFHSQGLWVWGEKIPGEAHKNTSPLLPSLAHRGRACGLGLCSQGRPLHASLLWPPLGHIPSWLLWADLLEGRKRPASPGEVGVGGT